jgi:hypothetical protein
MPDAWDVVVSRLEPETVPVMFIERPLYSFVVDKSAFSAQRIVVRSGGLLAHLIVECGTRRIPVKISEEAFYGGRSI